MTCRGFTLIEVLIVIAIFALIVLVAAPLSGSWVRDANVLEAEGQLTQAVGRAKAAAFRNKMGGLDTNPVAAICLSAGNLLTVREGTSAGVAPSCAATPQGDQLWQTQIDENVSVKRDATNAFTCVCFNNKGMATTQGTCSSCASTAGFLLSASGVSSRAVSLY